MRIHLPSLPHTQTTTAYDWCAYTAKVRRFAGMMTRLGHEVILYAGEENEADCAEHVVVVCEHDRRRWFGDWDGVEAWWDRFEVWDPLAPWWQTANARTADAVRERAQPGDVLGIIGGRCQQELVDEVPGMRAVEWGVGYEGVFAEHRVFESYAWLHHVAGLRREDARWYDAVIPNSFDPEEFLTGETKEDYLLFMGRMIERKGLAVVTELAKTHRVLTAGQGETRVPGAEHLGVVTGKEKAELLARARAVLVPTTYLEPFGGVAVEAMMSGTPAITTDWGAFTETVDQGVTGFRCRTLAGFQEAVERADRLSPPIIRARALTRFSTSVVGDQYDSYLRRLATLDGEGWYATSDPAPSTLTT